MTDALPGDTLIDFDLDAELRPSDDVKPPYRTKVGGKVITMTDPGEVDWKDLLAVEAPTDLLRYILSEEDRDHLRETSLPGWKLGVLMDRYSKHFDLDKTIARAREEERRQSQRSVI